MMLDTVHGRDAGPLRIVMVAHSRMVGGMQRHVLTLANALAAQGHSLAYAGPLDGWLGEQMRAAGHRCEHVPMHGTYDLLSAWRLARLARQWRADVLHSHSPRGARYAVWAARRASVPTVETAHTTSPWKWFGSPVIAVSQAVRQVLLNQGLPGDRITVVYSGIPDFGAVTPPRPGPISAQRPLALGMAARFNLIKGQDLAIEASALLHPRLPLRLRLAGSLDTAWAQTMRNLAHARGLDGVVEFSGECSDIAALLADLDGLLAPSRFEAFGLTLLEAFSAGRPVIGTRIGGIPEVVEHGRTGLLCEPDSPAALAAAIERFAADDAWREQAGRATRQVFETRFTVDAMLAGTLKVYQRAMQAARTNA